MLSTAHTSAPFFYVECDIPEGQTLAAWRHARDAARRGPRRRRLFGFLPGPRVSS